MESNILMDASFGSTVMTLQSMNIVGLRLMEKRNALNHFILPHLRYDGIECLMKRPVTPPTTTSMGNSACVTPPPNKRTYRNLSEMPKNWKPIGFRRTPE